MAGQRLGLPSSEPGGHQVPGPYETSEHVPRSEPRPRDAAPAGVLPSAAQPTLRGGGAGPRTLYSRSRAQRTPAARVPGTPLSPPTADCPRARTGGSYRDHTVLRGHAAGALRKASPGRTAARQSGENAPASLSPKTDMELCRPRPLPSPEKQLPRRHNPAPLKQRDPVAAAPLGVTPRAGQPGRRPRGNKAPPDLQGRAGAGAGRRVTRGRPLPSAAPRPATSASPPAQPPPGPCRRGLLPRRPRASRPPPQAPAAPGPSPAAPARRYPAEGLASAPHASCGCGSGSGGGLARSRGCAAVAGNNTASHRPRPLSPPSASKTGCGWAGSAQVKYASAPPATTNQRPRWWVTSRYVALRPASRMQIRACDDCGGAPPRSFRLFKGPRHAEDTWRAPAAARRPPCSSSSVPSTLTCAWTSQTTGEPTAHASALLKSRSSASGFRTQPGVLTHPRPRTVALSLALAWADPPPSSTPAHEAQRCGPWGTNHSHVTSVRRSTALTGAGGRLDWKATCPRPGALRVFVWGLHLQLGGFMIFVFFQKWWLGKQSTRAGVNLGSLHGAAGKEGWGCPKPSVPNTLRTRRYSPVEAAAKYDKPRC